MLSHTTVNKNCSDRKNCSESNDRNYHLNIIRFAVVILLTMCGILAGYLATVHGIRIDLEHKADNITVQNLERRVLSLEIYLKEEMLTKEDFYSFRENLQERLEDLKYREMPEGGREYGKTDY